MHVRRRTRRKHPSIRLLTKRPSGSNGTHKHAQAEPERERLQTEAFEQPGRILVVDDDDGLRDTVASLLERDLHTVFQACNGQEALEVAFKEKPDVVVLDIRMPVMDGFTACQRLKADPHLHYVPVLVLTAAADAETQTRALECGANDFLAKPVSGIVLNTRVRALLKYRRALQALERHQDELEQRVEERTAELREASEQLRKESERRRRTQETLENERVLLRTVIDTIPDAVFLKDAEGRFLVVNQRVVNDAGAKDAAAMLGKTDFDFFPHADAARFQAREQTILRTGQAMIGREFEYNFPDGRQVFTSTTKLPLRDKDGKVTGLLGIHRNISQQKKAELALAAERATLRTMLDNLLDIVFLKDASSRFVAVNKNVLIDLGAKSMEEVLGKTDFDFFPPETAQAFLDEERTVLTTGQPIINRVVKTTGPDGKVYYNLTTKLPLRDGTGRITGLLGINRNITEQKRMEQELANERATLRAMIDNLPDQVFLKDLESRFVMCNQSVVSNFGFSHMSEVIGKSDFDFMSHPSAEHHRKEEQEIMRSGVPMVNLQESYLDREGRQCWYLSTKIPLRDQDHRITGLLGINRDISEYKKLEQQLRQAQKMDAIGQLAGGIAHDFNNMLMVIQGYAECLQMESQLQEAHKKQVAAIHHAAERAARMTRQLLTFSRRQVVQLERVSLNAVLSDMGHMLQRLIGEHIRMENRLAPDAGHVHADSGQLQQVIMNLVLNARDAMPEGGHLVLETRLQELGPDAPDEYRDIPRGRYTLLTVTDSGHGMTSETQARLFEPFFTTKPFGKGTGLGLSVVYGVVKQCGGHILVSSEVQRGTTFTLLFPTATIAPKIDAATPSPRPGQGTETILLVEDEDEVRGLARVFLAQSGYQVLEESDPVAAVNRAATFPHPIHLVVTDVLMPNLKGTQMVEQLHRTRPTTKVLYISGYPSESAATHEVRTGEHGFLQKPFSATDLTRKVREILDRE